MSDLYKSVLSKAKTWLTGHYDKETKEQVRQLIEGDRRELIDAFYKDLEFGTGGLRGVMGAGTNRMNKYTVAQATQGLANYLQKTFGSDNPIKVAIGFDSRHNSRQFAGVASMVFAANGIESFLFESLRPTPELSFAIRHLGCRSGVIITASHNPPEYNGYKAYWEDGGQVTFPHDKNIIEEVRKIKDISELRMDGPSELIHIIGKDIDELFLEKVRNFSFNPGVIKKNTDIGIVYTPLHGSGIKLIPAALKNAGFRNIYRIHEQEVIDGDFPTVSSPNPEEPAALKLAIEKAEAVNAELVLGTDPDSDRLGVAVKDRSGQYVILNGNQTGALMTWYIITQLREKGLLKGNEYIIKTIVTSDLLERIAVKNGIKCHNVLTGFKYFARLMLKLENSMKYIGGGEESFGYLPADFVRDKDAVTSAALVAEIAASAKERGLSVYDQLISIYQQYGLFKERLVTVVRKGREGAGEIAAMMVALRDNPPEVINNSRVVKINDFLELKSKDLTSGMINRLESDKSNVLQFYLEDGSVISARPSGTEPKIKYYFSVNTILSNTADFEKSESVLEDRIDRIVADMDLTD